MDVTVHSSKAEEVEERAEIGEEESLAAQLPGTNLANGGHKGRGLVECDRTAAIEAVAELSAGDLVAGAVAAGPLSHALTTLETEVPRVDEMLYTTLMAVLEELNDDTALKRTMN